MTKAEADWQDAFDAIPDLICILDRDARITRVNRSFSARLNIPPEKLVGSYCHEALHASSMPPPNCPFPIALKGRQPVQEEDREIGEAEFSASLVPFYDSAGNPRGAIHIFREIMDRNKLTKKSTQSDKMESIGTLAAEIAHEINNPLHYINNYLYLLSEALPQDFSGKDYVQKIQGGIDNLTALTRDLLDFLRPASEEFSLMDIHAIVDASVALAEKGLIEKQIELIKDYRCSDTVVHGSGRMLQQVCQNLIQNAIDAMPDGGRIIITTSCVADQVVLEFEDTGIGIPQKNLTKIFDPFFTTKKNAPRKGTGLGLAISYNILHQHQGEITVVSREGKGAKFIIILPRAVE